MFEYTADNGTEVVIVDKCENLNSFCAKHNLNILACGLTAAHVFDKMLEWDYMVVWRKAD
jgi:hypothetical protein